MHQTHPNTKSKLLILINNLTLIRRFVDVSNWPCHPWAYKPWPLIACDSAPLSHHPRTLSHHCAGCESCILQCFKHFRSCEQHSCDTLAHACPPLDTVQMTIVHATTPEYSSSSSSSHISSISSSSSSIIILNNENPKRTAVIWHGAVSHCESPLAHSSL